MWNPFKKKPKVDLEPEHTEPPLGQEPSNAWDLFKNDPDVRELSRMLTEPREEEPKPGSRYYIDLPKEGSGFAGWEVYAKENDGRPDPIIVWGDYTLTSQRDLDNALGVIRHQILSLQIKAHELKDAVQPVLDKRNQDHA